MGQNADHTIKTNESLLVAQAQLKGKRERKTHTQINIHTNFIIKTGPTGQVGLTQDLIGVGFQKNNMQVVVKFEWLANPFKTLSDLKKIFKMISFNFFLK